MLVERWSWRPSKTEGYAPPRRWTLPSGADPDEVRLDSTFGRRTAANGDAGPLVVGTNYAPPPPQGDGGAPRTPRTRTTTCVTRSIGDWDASRAVVPEPEIRAWPLADDRGPVYDRVVIASDGLWDLLTHAQVERAARAAGPDPQRAADRLLEIARATSEHLGYRGLKDDTTVLVVDVNPTRIPFPPPRCACRIA